jgi:hypothetical protein
VSLDLSLHWRVLFFTLAVTVGTALLFGVAPAFRGGRLSPYDAIKQQGGGVAGEGPGAFGGPLVVVQVALSLVLVFGAGLFLRTFSRLANRDLGLSSDGVLLVGLDAQRSPVAQAELDGLFERAREAVAALPGVAGAAISVVNPVSGQGLERGFRGQGIPPSPAGSAGLDQPDAGLFATYGTAVLAGRD